jgi:hypothetical protein
MPGSSFRAAIVLMVPPLHARSASRLQGSAFDPSGAPVSGAAARVCSTSTGVRVYQLALRYEF